jgi:hypothetical protein
MQVCWASPGILIFRYMQFLLTIGPVRIRTFREPNLTVLLGPAFANLPEPALAPCLWFIHSQSRLKSVRGLSTYESAPLSPKKARNLNRGVSRVCPTTQFGQ